MTALDMCVFTSMPLEEVVEERIERVGVKTAILEGMYLYSHST